MSLDAAGLKNRTEIASFLSNRFTLAENLFCQFINLCFLLVFLQTKVGKLPLEVSEFNYFEVSCSPKNVGEG